MTKFSIIVPAYNVAEYISDCIHSVLSQEMSDFELILVDDGSTDNTLEICREFAASDSRISIISQTNAGLSAARNAGIKKASGEYILFLDGDDLLTDTALGRLASALATFDNSVDMLRFQSQDLLPDGTLVHWPEAGFAPLPGVLAFLRIARCHYVENAWLYCYRTAFFRSHHFAYAPGRLAEDFGLTPLVIGLATSVAAIPDICYTYRTRSGSIMHSSDKLNRRVADAYADMAYQISLLAGLDDGAFAHIIHYLVLSFFSLAAKLPYKDFLYYYQAARVDNFLIYVRPTTIRNIPRSVLLRFTPKLFYDIFSGR